VVARWARAVVTLAVAVTVFFGSIWVFHYSTWSWLPTTASDRWVVAAGFATLVGTSAFLLLGTWADGKQRDAAAGDAPADPAPPAGGGDQITVHGPFNAPTVIKGTQINRGGKSDEG